MKAFCYLTICVVYAFEAALGHGFVFFPLGALYAIIAFTEWVEQEHSSDTSK